MLINNPLPDQKRAGKYTKLLYGKEENIRWNFEIGYLRCKYLMKASLTINIKCRVNVF